MKINEKEKVNLFIKNKLLNDNIKNKKFIDNTESEELIHIIEINGELWASILYEDFFKNFFKRNKQTITNFIPFFLIPIKINNYIKLKNKEDNKDFYLKLLSTPIETKIEKEIFYIKNQLKHEKMETEDKIIKIDKRRKINYLFSREDKKKIIKEIKKIKRLDVFNIFEIKKLIYFIEEQIKTYIENKNNYFILSSLIDNEYLLDLKIASIKKEFKKTKPLSFIIREDKIILEIKEG
jgi:hypothetical protein